MQIKYAVLNKEFSTDGVTLNVQCRATLLNVQHFVYKTIKLASAYSQNTKGLFT